MSNIISPSHAADAIIAKIREGNGFELEEIKGFQESPKVYEALAAKMGHVDPKTKIDCLEEFLELGSILEVSKDDGRLDGPPYIADLILIHTMVAFLGDKDLDVQNAASRELLKWVPDLYLRNFSNELIGRIAANPGITDAAELLAKTGSEKARGMIRTNSVIRSQSDFSTRKSLAKLGDSLLEKEFIESYKREKDPREKSDLALALGFIASPKSILTLARDLRNPMTYPWNRQAPRSFRVHVIEGLHIAYPMEKLFWRPMFSPTEDTYYEAIEKWATEHLGVTWKEPRPPFLYEISVPTAAPR
ncbi:MAG: hypothetical protein JWO30_319 [Fibrobacteres bacterium]|nr:hypothetical protein [Fibrobacterota bacterium]